MDETGGSEMGLRQQLSLNQLMFTTGVQPEEARRLLVASDWQLEVALSAFFQEAPACTDRRRPTGQTSTTTTTAEWGSSGRQPFQDSGNQMRSCLCPMQMESNAAPANTPVTPPNLPDLCQCLQQMLPTSPSASSSSSTAAAMAFPSSGAASPNRQPNNPFGAPWSSPQSKLLASATGSHQSTSSVASQSPLASPMSMSLSSSPQQSLFCMEKI